MFHASVPHKETVLPNLFFFRAKKIESKVPPVSGLRQEVSFWDLAVSDILENI